MLESDKTQKNKQGIASSNLFHLMTIGLHKKHRFIYYQ